MGGGSRSLRLFGCCRGGVFPRAPLCAPLCDPGLHRPASSAWLAWGGGAGSDHRAPELLCPGALSRMFSSPQVHQIRPRPLPHAPLQGPSPGSRPPRPRVRAPWSSGKALHLLLRMASFRTHSKALPRQDSSRQT